ncbi:biopolymer transporter ExbD [Jannaschia sp. 2305UL9-9]|uniref:biopolymer transporter ExbD n=1 Tax=Jannaschia sp. 2305UL9-9 TaxID=3121638 RepID=UPI003528E08D
MRRRGFVRRALTLTPLVDVIFLLLLFFMLTSTFTRFGEIEVAAAASGAGGAAATTDVGFLTVAQDELRLGPQALTLTDLPVAVGEGRLLVSLRDDVTAQRLIDVLAVLRAVPGLSLTVLR